MKGVQNGPQDMSPNEYERMELAKAKSILSKKE